MPDIDLADEPLDSTFAHDAEMAELVELFVQELPDRMNHMMGAANNQDWREVARLAHQLKGAGGSHGFPLLTEAAAVVESAAATGNAKSLAQAIGQLDELCKRAR